MFGSSGAGFFSLELEGYELKAVYSPSCWAKASALLLSHASVARLLLVSELAHLDQSQVFQHYTAM